MGDNGNVDDEGRSPIIPEPRLTRASTRRAKNRAKTQTRQRILFGALVAGLLASIIFLIAMSTTDWVRLNYPTGLYLESSETYVESQVSGLFRLCRVERDNISSRREHCHMQTFFPSKETIEGNSQIDYVILDYTRSGAAVSIIAIVISAGANFFTWYSINEPRYMFKRVAASLHLITAACVLVCVEVFRNSLEYARGHLPGRFPADATQQLGASYGVAWFTLAVYVGVGIAMFILSTKRKGERAYSLKEATENEPVHLGRI